MPVVLQRESLMGGQGNSMQTVAYCKLCKKTFIKTGEDGVEEFCSNKCEKNFRKEISIVQQHHYHRNWVVKNFPGFVEEVQNLLEEYDFYVYWLIDTKRKNFNKELMGYVGRSKDAFQRLHSHFIDKAAIFYQRDPADFKVSILAYSNDLEDIRMKESFWIAEKKTLRPFGYNRIP